MLLNFKTALIFIVAAMSLASCYRDKSAVLEIKKTIELNDFLNTICIENNSASAVTFSLNINEIFPLDFETISNEIDAIVLQEKLSKQEAAYIFVRRNTFYNSPYSIESWQHEPLLFINSIGGGFCDDLASVLAATWKHKGDSARVIGIDAHVIPEVFADRKWQMLDPTCGTFYTNQKGEKLSVEEIGSNLNAMFTTNVDTQYFNPLYRGRTFLSVYFSKLYEAKEFFRDVTQSSFNYAQTSQQFTLPGKSSLQISYNKEFGFANISVHLHKGSIGLLQLPLVPFSAKGNMSFIANSEIFHLNDTSVLLPTKSYINEIEIAKVSGKSEVNYLVNPKLKFLKAQNRIQLNSSAPLVIKATKSNKTEIQFGTTETFVGLKSLDDMLFFNNAGTKTSTTNTDSLKQQFLQAIKTSNRIAPKEREELIQLYNEYLNLIKIKVE